MLFLCNIKIDSQMNVDDKTKAVFTLEKLFGFIGFIVLCAWGVGTYVSKQMERDDIQDNKIDKVDSKVEALKVEFKDSHKQINDKLDLIIQSQAKDHDKVNEMVIRHEYLNLNKQVK